MIGSYTIFLLTLEVGYLHPPAGPNLFITSVKFSARCDYRGDVGCGSSTDLPVQVWAASGEPAIAAFAAVATAGGAKRRPRLPLRPGPVEVTA